MMRARAFLIAGVLGVTPILSPQAVEAQFFSSVHSRSDAPAEARDASSKALAGLSRVLAALSNLETGNEAGAKENFDTATASLSASITSFRSLAQGRIVSLKIKLEELHPEERAFISDPGLLALGTNQLNTAGDVYALTAGALSVMLTNLKTFRQSPSATNYAIVRDDMSLLLRIGQVTSALLESAH